MLLKKDSNRPYEAAERLQFFMNFMGYGNEKCRFPGREGPLWFIGVEEARSLDAAKVDDEIRSNYGREWKCCPGENRGTSIYQVMSKVAVCLLPSDDPDSDPDFMGEHWRRFQYRRLFDRSSGTLQSNLRALPKPKARRRFEECSKTSHYKKTFGLDTYETYLASCKEQRGPAFCAFLDNAKPFLTICFGKDNWGDFVDYLGMRHETPFETDNFRIYKHRRVALVPFFTPRWGLMNDSKIRKLVELCKSMTINR